MSLEESTTQTAITLTSTLFILLTGFALLEAGNVRSKNASNIIFKNMMNTGIGVTAFAIIGGGIAVGKSAGGMIGTEFFLLRNLGYESASNAVAIYSTLLFSLSASSIMSGAIAERASLWTYITHVFFSNLLFFPLIAHWVWRGWLFDFGFIDHGGSGIVHVYGGVCSIVAVFLVGPRQGMIDDMSGKVYKKAPDSIYGHSTIILCLGAALLFYGFFGFNGVSGLMVESINPSYFYVLATLNTAIAAASGTITTTVITRVVEKRYSVVEACMGLLAGCISICSSCGFIQPWAAFLTGIASSVVYVLLKKLIYLCKLDDCIDAFALHAGAGAVGLCSTALFYNDQNGTVGLVYGNASLLYKQLVGLIVIAVVSVLSTMLLLLPLKLTGTIRISSSLESEGYDKTVMNEPAYPEIYAKGDFIKFREYLKTIQGYDEFKKEDKNFNEWNSRSRGDLEKNSINRRTQSPNSTCPSHQSFVVEEVNGKSSNDCISECSPSTITPDTLLTTTTSTTPIMIGNMSMSYDLFCKSQGNAHEFYEIESLQQVVTGL